MSRIIPWRSLRIGRSGGTVVSGLSGGIAHPSDRMVASVAISYIDGRQDTPAERRVSPPTGVRMNTPPSDFDGPWKEIMERYFRDFMEFFFPSAAGDIDWSRDHEFLDNELRRITRDAKLGRRYVDRLVKVWRAGGTEAWVLVHVEVQGWPEEDFGERMYIYNNRIYDRYRRNVASFALLADESERWRPPPFEYELWGTRVLLVFAAVKLLDYRAAAESLLDRGNVFAIVTLAHLRALGSRGDADLRLTWKTELVKSLYRAGHDKGRILDLLKFIDWIMGLPEEIDNVFLNDIQILERGRDMRFISTPERVGIRNTLKESIVATIDSRFQRASTEATERLESVYKIARLREIFKLALTAENLEDILNAIHE